MIKLDDASWATLRAVNAAVNADTRYVGDAEHYGKADYWTPADGAGDCEDYALAKCRRLTAQGWPRAALRIALCWTETGDYHAVLTVEAEDGAWVLDNRTEQILPWEIGRAHV